MTELADQIEALGMAPLVECHSHEDIGKLGSRSWPVVGINNRDLRTFEVDLQHSLDLLRELPTAAIKVAESGLSSRRDVMKLAAAGFDAFLIGESLISSDDPAGKLAELTWNEGR